MRAIFDVVSRAKGRGDVKRKRDKVSGSVVDVFRNAHGGLVAIWDLRDSIPVGKVGLGGECGDGEGPGVSDKRARPGGTERGDEVDIRIVSPHTVP